MFPPAPDKGKGKLHLDPPKTRVCADKESHGPKAYIEKEAHVLHKTISGKGEIIETGDIEKVQPTLNLQKEM